LLTSSYLFNDDRSTPIDVGIINQVVHVIFITMFHRYGHKIKNMRERIQNSGARSQNEKGIIPLYSGF